MWTDSNQAVALLSSGLDSTVSLALALEDGMEVAHCLTFDYGQKAAQPEIERSQAIASFYGIHCTILTLPWLAAITHSALAQGSQQELPSLEIAQLDQISEITLETARQVWVPNRNGVFINIAAAYADSFGDAWILMGINAEEAATFPDNTPQFVEAVNQSLAFSTQVQVQVRSYVQPLNKIEIFQEALRLQVPLDLIWSCYRQGNHHCGDCESCCRLKRAVFASGRGDLMERFFHV